MARAGVYPAVKKDGSVYYRSSITHGGKHISLGSYPSELKANRAYKRAHIILSSKKRAGLVDSASIISSYYTNRALAFDKYISLINLRDNDLYIKNPIYVFKRYILYFYSPDCIFTFDIDDLFYYSSHKIMMRGGHVFTSDYGMQVNIKQRYGIGAFAVMGRDYEHINGDSFDFRYDNIKIINRYNGVKLIKQGPKDRYRASILINGSYSIGTYESEIEAAIAYNKAADVISAAYPTRRFRLNYIDSISAKEYADIYTRIKISKKIKAAII